MTTQKRRRYVPMDVNVAFGKFGTKLDAKWGMEGICAWMLLLAAAKREHEQGVFTYTSETEAWTKLGAVATKFTFTEFVTFCGRNKQTRRTVSGRISYVEITGWKQWNNEFKTQTDSERKASKRAQSTPDTPTTPPGHDSDKKRSDSEAEAETEREYDSEVEEVADVIDVSFPAGLPISIEKQLELKKMLPYFHDTDAGSLGVLEASARPVSFAAVCRVRESVQHANKRIGVGYAVAALKSERQEAA